MRSSRHCLKACESCERQSSERDISHHCYTKVAEGKKEHAKALHLVADRARFCDLSADLIASQSPLISTRAGVTCRANGEA